MKLEDFMNGKTDAVSIRQKYLKDISKKDKKVTVLKHDINKGQSKSIKTGIDFSNDKYVKSHFDLYASLL